MFQFSEVFTIKMVVSKEKCYGEAILLNTLLNSQNNTELAVFPYDRGKVVRHTAAFSIKMKQGWEIFQPGVAKR